MLWSLLVWVVFGFVVGLVARAVMPGRQALGFWATVGLGIAGSFVGGIGASFLFGHALSRAHPAGFIGSVIGALVLMAVVGLVRRSGPRRA